MTGTAIADLEKEAKGTFELGSPKERFINFANEELLVYNTGGFDIGIQRSGFSAITIRQLGNARLKKVNKDINNVILDDCVPGLKEKKIIIREGDSACILTNQRNVAVISGEFLHSALKELKYRVLPKQDCPIKESHRCINNYLSYTKQSEKNCQDYLKSSEQCLYGCDSKTGKCN